MTAQTDNQPKASKRRSRKWRVLILVLCSLLGLIAFVFSLPFIIGAVLMMTEGKETHKDISPEEVSRQVALGLMCWEILAPKPSGETQWKRSWDSIASRVRGIRGYHTSDSFHGDGIDCYEFELSTDLAAELRAALAGVEPRKPPWYIPDTSAPSWWPKRWPSDVQCYERDGKYFFLPSAGTRAWWFTFRT